MEAVPDRATLRVVAATDLAGPHEVAVRFGEGPIDGLDRPNDPTIQKTLAFVPPGPVRSVVVITDTGRRAFRQGEAIPIHLVRRASETMPVPVRLDLTRDGVRLATVRTPVGRDFAGRVPAALTLRLPPGRYRLVPSAQGHQSYALDLDIASKAPDSPLQRILYHEFNQGATARQNNLADVAERMVFI